MQDEKMTPWEVKGAVNYLAQITHFGTCPIDEKLIARWEKVTGTKVHRFIRRGLVFSHQDIEHVLNCVEQGIPVYLYTGRGPSSESMHLGHMVPFKLTRYLQKALNCIVVIQMSDDEKFLFKDGSGPCDLNTYREYSYKNARDIIACGFDPEKTLIFSNLESNAGDLYFNNILLMKSTNMNTVKSTYGLGETIPESIVMVLKKQLEELTEKKGDQSLIDDLTSTLKKFTSGASNSIGQCVWPAFQCGPAFCTSFKNIFIQGIMHSLETKGDLMPSHVKKNLEKVLKELNTLGAAQSIMCLVPMAIDQAPYFRMARDAAQTLGCPKPAVIHSEFLPGLKQSHGKMSTTVGGENSTLFLNMSPADVQKTIKRHAFSGGRDSMEDHKMYGGDIRIDICYQYLTYFLEDDQELFKIAQAYTDGSMGSGQIKKITAELVAKEISDHQALVAKVTDQVIDEFFNWDRVFDIGGCYQNTQSLDESIPVNFAQGINFDRTFGLKCKNPNDTMAANPVTNPNPVTDTMTDTVTDNVTDTMTDTVTDTDPVRILVAGKNNAHGAKGSGGTNPEEFCKEIISATKKMTHG